MQSTPSAFGVPSASFFPTPSEISVSLRWLKEHPVMAAATCAAATAVSMAAYFVLQTPKGDDFFESDLIACKGTKRGESNASDYPTEKDSSLSLGSMGGEITNAEHLIPLESVPEKGFNHLDEYESESPEWGWYVSTTPPEEMYAPSSYKYN